MSTRWRGASLLGLGVLLAAACSSSSPPPTGFTPPANAGSAGQSGAGAGAGTGGSSSSGGTASGGALAGAETGGAGAAGNGGAQSGAGEQSGSGQGGVTGGGAAGAGGNGSDARVAAEVLDGFAILKPCKSWKPSGMPNNGDCCCEEDAASENQHISKQFGGDPQVTYSVKLRVAGVAERYWYEAGQLDATSKIFYTGGLPTIHSASAPNTGLKPGQGACKIHPPETDGQFALSFAVPSEIAPQDGCYNGFNIFALTVSEPKRSYYLNYTDEYDHVDRQPHSVYKTDYTVTISIQGQAKLDFYTIDGDHHQVTNNGTLQLPDLKTPQPYNGNFLELTVLGVTPL